MRTVLFLCVVALFACDKEAESKSPTAAHKLEIAKCKAGTQSACKELEESCEGGTESACAALTEAGRPLPGSEPSSAPRR